MHTPGLYSNKHANIFSAVTLGGGFAFLVFGIIYLIEAMYIV